MMENESVDLIVTDPPYLIDYKSGKRDGDHRFSKAILGDSDYDLVHNYINECYRVLKQDKAMYMFCSDKTIDYFIQESKKAGFTIKNTIIWYKPGGGMGDLKSSFASNYEPCLLLNKGKCELMGKRISDVWTFPRVNVSSQLHQNQKPVELISRCIQYHSKEGEVVFDGFMGSGTTAIASKRLGRNFVGAELDDYYYNVAIERVNKEAFGVSVVNGEKVTQTTLW